MKIILTILFALFANTFYGQTFTNTIGGNIPDNSTTICYPITVSGVGIINGTNGLQSICLNITHAGVGDLVIKLKAPDGSILLLSDQNGGSTGINYTNTCFTMTAVNPITTSSAPFTGNFIPEENIGWYNNNINADGIWSLCIADSVFGDVGVLNNWSIAFGASPAAFPVTGCGTNAAASHFCQSSPAICNLNGYCGNTSSAYAPPYKWPELEAAFCGGIQNNSFIKFVASATAATFSINVTSSTTGAGIQAMVFSGGCGFGSGPVTNLGCEISIPPGITPLNATGLVPGNTYYLMVDGYFADVCNYTISAVAGVNVLGVTPLDPNYCIGNTGIPLTASGGNGTYTWSPAAGLSATSGTTVSASPTITTTYTVTSSTSSTLNCPIAKTVTVTAIPKPAVTAPTSVCINDNAYLTPSTGGTWASSNTAIATVTNAGVISGAAVGNVTFTFTNSTTNCSSTSSSVAVTTSIIPIFTPITPICSGSTAPLLPTTSLNGITGTWSPALVSNITSDIYTFTPNAAFCASTVTLSIAVNTSITPTFAPIAPICNGAAAPVLPSTSTNGISGTWSPATVSNTATNTYTFTPNNSTCGTITSLIVTVNTPTTPTFSTITPFCSGATAPVLPTTSLNGITGTWNPATVNNTVSSTYTFTPANGQCANIATLPVSIIVNITPTFAAIAPICVSTIAPILPTTSTNGITGTWNPATVSNTASGTYIFTPNAGQCAISVNKFITINAFTTTFFVPIIPFCEGTASPILSTTSSNGVTGTWSPSIIDNTASATYIFTPNVGQCASTASQAAVVLPKPIVNIVPNTSICENTSFFINAANPNPLTTYLWQDGSTNATYNVTQGGTYTVVANIGICSTSKTIVVGVDSLPKFTLTGKKTICPSEINLLSATAIPAYSYLWQDASTNTNLSVTTEGLYYVDVTNNCGTIRKSILIENGICILYLPNAFTPNNDNKNDIFRPVGGDNNVREFSMDIFNRWGQKMYTTTNISIGWDGTYIGKDQPNGSYVYFITYIDKKTDKVVTLKSSFLLIR